MERVDNGAAHGGAADPEPGGTVAGGAAWLVASERGMTPEGGCGVEARWPTGGWSSRRGVATRAAWLVDGIADVGCGVWQQRGWDRRGGGGYGGRLRCAAALPLLQKGRRGPGWWRLG